MTEDKKEDKKSRTENEVKQVILLRDCYHKIKQYLEDGNSTARHALWLQSQILKAHLLTVEDVSIDKDYRNSVVPGKRSGVSVNSASRVFTKPEIPYGKDEI